MLGACSYPDALARSRAATGRGLSKQAFHLLPKVEEVDRLVDAHREVRIVEVHPEVSFAALAARPMAHPKRTPAGRAERVAALRTACPALVEALPTRLAGAAPDDVLDAVVVAWSARRYATGSHEHLGGERDGRGLRMEIIV